MLSLSEQKLRLYLPFIVFGMQNKALGKEPSLDADSRVKATGRIGSRESGKHERCRYMPFCSSSASISTNLPEEIGIHSVEQTLQEFRRIYPPALQI